MLYYQNPIPNPNTNIYKKVNIKELSQSLKIINIKSAQNLLEYS